MTIVRPTHYTANPDQWHEFLKTLGFSPAFEDDVPWTVYDGGGRLAVHAVMEGDPLHGTTELDLLVQDLDAAQAAITAAGFPVERAATDDDDDAAGDLLFTEVGGVQVTVAAPAGEARGDLIVQPIWYAPDFAEPAALLRALGLVEQVEASSGDWVEFAADGGGLAALHRGKEPQVELSLRYSGVLEDLQPVLTEAGYRSRISEAPAAGIRTLHVTTPDGWELWINGPLA